MIFRSLYQINAQQDNILESYFAKKKKFTQQENLGIIKKKENIYIQFYKEE